MLVMKLTPASDTNGRNGRKSTWDCLEEIPLPNGFPVWCALVNHAGNSLEC